MAEAIAECEGLEEIRLANCGIRDEGAIAIFEKLKSSQTMLVIDLSRNHLTDRCFESLVTMLQFNQSIQRVELKGLQVKNKFSIHRLKAYMSKIVM